MEEKNYTLIEWPEGQKYMDEEWFEDEAILANEAGATTGATYLIPTARIKHIWFVVAYNFINAGRSVDYYERLESLGEARRRYNKLLEDDPYTISICLEIEGTDHTS